MGFLFILIPLFIAVIWVIVISKLVKSGWSAAKEKRNNDNSPVEYLSCKVVGKRTRVWGDHARTDYYTTFEDSFGNRMELKLSGEEYGLLVEGDMGTLEHQGTRYIGFQR